LKKLRKPARSKSVWCALLLRAGFRIERVLIGHPLYFQIESKRSVNTTVMKNAFQSFNKLLLTLPLGK
jgi:hypothetical protein